MASTAPNIYNGDARSGDIKKPSYAMRRTVALGLIAVTAMTGKALVESQHEIDAFQTIQSAGPAAVENYQAGKLSHEDFAVVTATKSQAAFTEAVDVVADDKDVRPTVAAIDAQTGPYVDQGEQLVISRDELDPHVEAK